MIKELEEISLLLKGELLTEEDANIAVRLLFKTDDDKQIVFTNKELFKIYVDVKCRINFAPEENEDFEIELSNSIINKIENGIQ